MKLRKIILASAASTLLCGAHAESAAPAAPIDPVAGVISALREHQIVAVGEVHAIEPMGRYWLRLLRDPGVTDLVDDVVLEAGNAVHQATVDRFTAGEDVPYAQLRRAWEDSNPIGMFDLPMYEELYWAVRARNKLHPDKRPMRVLLAGSPVDWSKVKSRADLQAQQQASTAPWRNDSPWIAKRIATEVLKRGRKALVLQGNMHTLKAKPAGAVESGDSWEMSILREEYGASVFSVVVSLTDPRQFERAAGLVQLPAFIRLRGTPWGAVPVGQYIIGDPAAIHKTAKFNPAILMAAQEQVDAVVFLALPAELTSAVPSRGLCNDQEYIERRMSRLRISGDDKSTLPVTWRELFEQRCERTLICGADYAAPKLSPERSVNGRCGRD
ncbi:hypothetical protein [Steroidobacter sp.]|uniref:hypothetical protein n=1 Tax=Steroidobacter sp. TaxID=1978227 RepID=UPI001A5CA55C|nr:hypothetical protein [Steroidobacter sp.]MBL8269486.1 hypothetical protein [Steroidobacter sp.]